MQYSIEDIKQAFWNTFHKTGEVWFDYLSSEEENTLSTQYKWDEFLEELNKEIKKELE